MQFINLVWNSTDSKELFLIMTSLCSCQSHFLWGKLAFSLICKFQNWSKGSSNFWSVRWFFIPSGWSPLKSQSRRKPCVGTAGKAKMVSYQTLQPSLSHSSNTRSKGNESDQTRELTHGMLSSGICRKLLAAPLIVSQSLQNLTAAANQ